MSASPAATDGHRLLRTLTLVPATSVIIANIVGTGVFVKARVMTCNVGSPSLVLLVWVLAGVLSLAGAILYAELSTMMPRAGGEFNFIGAAYGRLWAFLHGWTRTVGVGASMAALAIVFVIFLNDLLGSSLSPFALRTVPVLVIIASTVLNLTSARANGWVATAMTALKIALVLLVGGAAFLLGDGSFAGFSAGFSGVADLSGGCSDVPESARFGVTGFGAAMLGALWGYNGWAIIASLGGEVKNPSWTLPRCLIGGTTVVILLYVFVNASYFYVLSPAEVAAVSETSSVAFEVVTRVLGAGAASAMAVILLVSTYGTLHSTQLAVSRTPYALAKNGMLPRSLELLSAHGVPVVAVLVLGVWSSILALSGTFDVLTDIYIFVLWIFYAMTAASVFVLRRRYPDADRPYRTWGYPVVPALFVLVALYLLINTFVATPLRALAGLGLVIAGLPVYGYYRRALGKDEPPWLASED